MPEGEACVLALGPAVTEEATLGVLEPSSETGVPERRAHWPSGPPGNQTIKPTAVDQLRSLFERGLGSGEYLPNATLADWEPVIEDGPRPGKLDWTVRIRVSV